MGLFQVREEDSKFAICASSGAPISQSGKTKKLNHVFSVEAAAFSKCPNHQGSWNFYIGSLSVWAWLGTFFVSVHWQVSGKMAGRNLWELGFDVLVHYFFPSNIKTEII